jgi:hypothetical protein
MKPAKRRIASKQWGVHYRHHRMTDQFFHMSAENRDFLIKTSAWNVHKVIKKECQNKMGFGASASDGYMKQA